MLLRPLRRDELPVPAARLARWLIGKTLIRQTPAGRMIGRIVETEAYVVGDASGHAYRGKTNRNASLFLEPGHAYVYFVYGCWFSLNVSAGRTGVGSGVLLRALEPLEGLDLMVANRPVSRPTDLARGPGRLATALGITREQDGLDLCAGGGSLWLAEAVRKRGRIGVGPRIGISLETHRPLRFFELGNPSVSGPRSRAR
ncbi:MAG TPA: DNA-3-methyladenine glycosylase [Reyranella sp.]|jgi:DNA-3-methyladenine glycosylase